VSERRTRSSGGEPAAEELEAYLNLSKAEIVRLVLCLLIEEGLKHHLSPFRSRPQDLFPQPVQGGEELLVGGLDVVPVGNAPR